MPTHPTFTFMLKRPAHIIAFGFGSGLSPKAPGTIGSLWGWFSWATLSPFLSPISQIVLLVIATGLGWWACMRTAQALGQADPGAIVWDEIIAVWFILFVVSPMGLIWQTFAFVLFRLLDITKPGPIGWADQIFKGPGWRGAWGILWDDLVAAACTVTIVYGVHQWLN